MKSLLLLSIIAISAMGCELDVPHNHIKVPEEVTVEAGTILSTTLALDLECKSYVFTANPKMKLETVPFMHLSNLGDKIKLELPNFGKTVTINKGTEVGVVTCGN